MSRPQPEARSAYRHFSDVPTRWMDNDLYGHVNNVVYYSWFDTVVNLAAQAIYRVLVGLLPVLPDKGAEGLRHLGVSVEGRKFGDLINATLPAGHKLGEAQPLFPRVEKKPQAQGAA